METPEKQPRKLSPLIRAFVYLVMIMLAQFGTVWLIGKIYPPVPCGPFADQPCKPYVTTEGLILGALLPFVFVPFAAMQFKQIVMYAGALVPIKKLAVVLISAALLIVMFWQLIAGLGALLGRWFG